MPDLLSPVLRLPVLPLQVLPRPVLPRAVLRLALPLLGAVVMSGSAAAEPTPIRELLKLSCTGDYLEHCSMHPPGGPEVEACFRQNLRKLSPDCARAIRTYQREKKSTR